MTHHDLVPDWIDFVDDAINTDWNLDSLFTRLDQSISDTYGPRFRDEVMQTLKKIYTRK